MNWRVLKVGARLALGFGSLFLAMAILVLVSYFGTRSAVDRISASVDDAAAKAATVEAMHISVLNAGTAVRNIGLTTDVAQMNKFGDEFAAHMKAYLAAEAKLTQMQLDAEELALVSSAKKLREKTEPLVQRAFGIAKAFDPDNAAKLLLTEVGPLQSQWMGEFEKLAKLQAGKRALSLAETSSAIVTRSLTIAGVFLLVIAAGALFALALTRSITRPLKDAIEHAQRVATGDLSVDVQAQGQDEAAAVLQTFGNMSRQLAGLVGQVRQAVDSISTAAQEIATGNQDLSGRTEQQAATLQQTAASMSIMTETVRRNASSAEAADGLAQQAASISETGSSKMGQLERTMSAIDESSKRIVDIIAVIDGIAFQTNILALNAAVEAARAGEQGRGFAVVAGEVRTLAQRSAAAAKEIKSLIAESVERVEQGSRLVSDTGSTMRDVLKSVNSVKQMIAEISVASNEQQDGIEQINAAIANMDQGTQQNAALVEQAAAAALSLQDQSAKLAEVVSVFHLAPASALR